jgi:hypothetical protein
MKRAASGKEAALSSIRPGPQRAHRPSRRRCRRVRQHLPHRQPPPRGGNREEGDSRRDPLPLVCRYSEGLFALSDDPSVIERLLEDETGLLEAAVMPPVFRGLGDRVTTPGPFLVEGDLRREQGAVHLEVSWIAPFHERQRPFG